MVHARFIRPGTQKWAVGHDSDVTVTVKPEGDHPLLDLLYSVSIQVPFFTKKSSTIPFRVLRWL